MHIKFSCKKCGGQKFVGEEYYALGTYYVDITCVICGDSKDIEFEKLKMLLKKLNNEERQKGDAKRKTNNE